MIRQDTHLWERYDAAAAAGDEKGKRAAGAAIVENHKGFFLKYANETAFPQWDRDTRTEYFHELLCLALEKVEIYDRERLSTNGRTSSFINFVKPALKSVRWKVATEQDLIKHGVETRRLKADLERWNAAQLSERGVYPTTTEMAEFLTELHGKRQKPIREGQVRRLLDQPKVTWADAPNSAEDDGDGWELLASVNAETPEEEFIAANEEATRTNAVYEALAAVGLTDLEKCLVAERLMQASRRVVDGIEVSPGPTTLSALAQRFGMRPEAVRKAEQDLVIRLRGLIEL